MVQQYWGMVSDLTACSLALRWHLDKLRLMKCREVSALMLLENGVNWVGCFLSLPV